MSEPRDRLYLEEMIGAVDQLAVEIDGRPMDEWIEDRSRVAAASMYLIVLGEGAQNLSEPLKQAAEGVPWADIAGLRHRLAHGYFRADRRIVWQAAALHAPLLLPQLKALLASLGPES